MLRLLRAALAGAASLALATSFAPAPPAAAATVAAATATASPVSLSAPEAAFLVRINALRAQHGLGALAVDDRLTSVARTWTIQMAQAGGISHNPDLISAGSGDWVKLGENVGEGPDVDSLFTAFVNSPHHYANLVDPSFSRVGIGVVVTPAGVMYTTHDFEAMAPAVQAAAAAPASPPPPKPAPRPAPATPPTAPVAVPVAAPTPPAPAPAAATGAHQVLVELEALRSLDATSG